LFCCASELKLFKLRCLPDCCSTAWILLLQLAELPELSSVLQTKGLIFGMAIGKLRIILHVRSAVRDSLDSGCIPIY
jgi:hypothetical protein